METRKKLKEAVHEMLEYMEQLEEKADELMEEVDDYKYKTGHSNRYGEYEVTEMYLDAIEMGRVIPAFCEKSIIKETRYTADYRPYAIKAIGAVLLFCKPTTLSDTSQHHTDPVMQTMEQLGLGDVLYDGDDNYDGWIDYWENGDRMEAEELYQQCWLKRYVPELCETYDWEKLFDI